MQAENIEEMVRVIGGSFPNSGVFTPDVIKAWQRHDVISSMSVDEARVVQKYIVNKHNEFPSANVVVATYHQLFGRAGAQDCVMCQATGWIMPPAKENGDPGTITATKPPFQNIEYRYVIKCAACNN